MTVKLANENHVVMVDDNQGDLLLAKIAFEKSSLKNPWVSFSSGRAFLDHLDEVTQGRSPMPALVLLDLNMPRMGGLEVLEQCQRGERCSVLPVICILTSSSDPRDLQKALSLGASGFFTKPGAVREYVAFFDSLA